MGRFYSCFWLIDGGFRRGMRPALTATHVWLLFFLLFNSVVFSQDLDQIGKKDMVKVNGGMGYNMVGNFVDDQPQYRDPLSWVFTGNISVNVLGVSLPFTFSFSNAGKSYTQPFNMTALHPSYKWVKTHIGITLFQCGQKLYSALQYDSFTSVLQMGKNAYRYYLYELFTVHLFGVKLRGWWCGTLT